MGGFYFVLSVGELFLRNKINHAVAAFVTDSVFERIYTGSILLLMGLLPWCPVDPHSSVGLKCSIEDALELRTGLFFPTLEKNNDNCKVRGCSSRPFFKDFERKHEQLKWRRKWPLRVLYPVLPATKDICTVFCFTWFNSIDFRNSFNTLKGNIL